MERRSRRRRRNRRASAGGSGGTVPHLLASNLRVFRRSGYDVHDAQDLTQSFFQHLLENETLRRVSRDKGRFRSFLLGALKLCPGRRTARGSTL